MYWRKKQHFSLEEKKTPVSLSRLFKNVLEGMNYMQMSFFPLIYPPVLTPYPLAVY